MAHQRIRSGLRADHADGGAAGLHGPAGGSHPPAHQALISAAWPLLALAALALGCLPESGPGIGERLLEGRGFDHFNSGPGNERPLFFTRRSELMSSAGQGRALDLYLLRPGESTPGLLVQDVDEQEPLQFDARGRLYVMHARRGGPESFNPETGRFRFVHRLRRVDLASGQTIDLDGVRHARLSPGGTHVWLVREDGSHVTRTLDDVERVLFAEGAPERDPEFIGEDVCLRFQRGLRCLLAEGGPLVMPTARWVVGEHALAFPEGRYDLLVVSPDPASRIPGDVLQFWRVRLRPTPGEPAEVLLATGRPLNDDVVVSRHEPLFSFIDLDRQAPVARLRLVAADGRPGGAQLLESLIGGSDPETMGTFGWSRPALRPVRGEAWSLGPKGQLAIVRADGSQALHRLPPEPRRRFAFVEWVRDRIVVERYRPEGLSIDALRSGAGPRVLETFTADGRSWAYQEARALHLADADDPIGPSRYQVPDRDDRGFADVLGQGRLAAWSMLSWDRVRLEVLDAATLAPLVRVDEVRQALVTARGTLALTGRSSGGLVPGTLVLGLGSPDAAGPPEVLAQNVTQFELLTARPGADPLAPGQRLAYTVHARVPWRYDGLWLAELP